MIGTSMIKKEEMTEESKFRPARPSDAVHLVALNDIASRGLLIWVWGKFAAIGQSAIEVGRNRIRHRKDLPSHYSKWTVAEDGVEVVGAFAGYLLPQPYDPGDVGELPALYAPMLELESLVAGYWHLTALSVYPEFRGKGLGAALLRRAQTEAQNRGATRIALMVSSKNENALRLYQRNGFEEFARRPYLPFPGSFDSGDWILMIKQLKQ
jgi:ribosomal protein S18 acetylase RimI-like enzyme